MNQPLDITDTIDKLYACIRLMAVSGPRSPKARWHCLSTDGSRSTGPFHAAELAYRIHLGLMQGNDVVVDSKTTKRFVVREHTFLSTWLTQSEDTDRRILRGLVLCARTLAKHGDLPMQVILPEWAEEILTPEERRAFHILSLAPSCTPGEVRKRHRELAVTNHPDKGGEEEVMKEINWAYDVVQRLAG